MKTNQDHSANGGNNYALIIGISNYQDEKVTNLLHTRTDAQAIHDLLVDPERANFPEQNVHLLIDQDATRFAIEDAISGWLRRKAESGSKVVVFFAGHGAAEHNHSSGDEPMTYLLPYDARSDNLFASAISTRRFHELLASVHSERLATFLDACHSGAFEVKGARRVAVQAKCYAHLAHGKGRVLIAAAQPNQFSFEDESLGHGIFTHHLIEALTGAADFDNDGRVTIQEVFRYLAEHVPETVRKLGKQGTQEPLMEGVTTRDIVLTINPERIRIASEEMQQQVAMEKKQLRMQMGKLTDLWTDGDLPDPVYHEAVGLLMAHREDLSSVQERLLANLKPLLAGNTNVGLYLSNREMIVGMDQHQEMKASAGGREVISTSQEKPVAPISKKMFCIYCGEKTGNESAFCTQCGKKL